MKNEIKIGIGVVLLAGVGYYFYNKNKLTTSNVDIATEYEKNPSTLDKEKLAKEFATFAFPILNKTNNVKLPASIVEIRDKSGNLAIQVNKESETELSLYKEALAMLNAISNESDALFMLDELKKMVSNGKSKDYKQDLDTQIRMEKIQLKYPKAFKYFGS